MGGGALAVVEVAPGEHVEGGVRGGQQGARGLPRLGLARRGALVREVYGAHPQAAELRRQRGRERQPFEPALDVVPVRAKRLRRDGSAHQQPHALAGLVGGAPSQAMWAKTHPRDQALPVACSTSAASIARPEVLPRSQASWSNRTATSSAATTAATARVAGEDRPWLPGVYPRVALGAALRANHP